jgi:amidase
MAFTLAGARIALCRTPVWQHAEPATRDALGRAADSLRSAGAMVSNLDLPAPFADLVDVQDVVMRAEGRAAFLSEYRAHYDLIDQTVREEVENTAGFTRQQLLAAYNHAAECRAMFDRIAANYDAVLTPSAAGEAPIGLAATGPWVFNAMWSLLHVPVINIPGFTGPNGLPVGLSVVGPRFGDRKLLAVAEKLGQAFPQTAPSASDQGSERPVFGKARVPPV